MVKNEKQAKKKKKCYTGTLAEITWKSPCKINRSQLQCVLPCRLRIVIAHNGNPKGKQHNYQRFQLSFPKPEI